MSAMAFGFWVLVGQYSALIDALMAVRRPGVTPPRSTE
jgi:hypothetical protein